MDQHLCVIPLQECNTEGPGSANPRTIGYQRLLKGPIDIYDGKGYDEDLISNFLSEYYLLFYNETCVGFCSIYEEEDTVVLNEFEVFHEHRGFSYGSIFAKHLVHNFIKKTKRLEFYEIMSSAFIFWWRCLGGIYFVKHIADVIGVRCTENLQRFEEWTLKYKHRDQLNTYGGFSYVATFLTDFPKKSHEEIAAMVEATPWYQKLYHNRIPTPPRPCLPKESRESVPFQAQAQRPGHRPGQVAEPITRGFQTSSDRPGTPFPRLEESPLLSSLFQSSLSSHE